MEKFINLLDGTVMPIMLVVCGIILAYKIKLIKILLPVNFFHTLKCSKNKGGKSPIKSLCVALAGTLGVGNMAGVATAIMYGGAGAVMWMWIGALVSMSVKYGEVGLSVKYRKQLPNGEFTGGSMYTIKYGLRKYIGLQMSSLLAAIFAILCIINSLLTGNIVQTSSAMSALPTIPPFAIGLLMAVGILLSGLGRTDKISDFTYVLIPILSLIYILMSGSIIFRNFHLVPTILSRIINSAFNIHAVVGGTLGFSIKEAVRYGITRGMFSNEAGCGTAPSAHASADTRSPHHQGCFGIFEVIADTLILCTLTAFVILIAEEKYKFLNVSTNGIEATLMSFELMLGSLAKHIISVSILLFAFATVLAQIYYAFTAIGYFTNKAIFKTLFVLFSSLITVLSVYIEENVMWSCTDLIIGLMTVINTGLLFVMRCEIEQLSKYVTK